MIRFLHAHTDYKVVKDPETRHSTQKEVKFKTEGFTLSSTNEMITTHQSYGKYQKEGR
jgi:hypothetical protein